MNERSAWLVGKLQHLMNDRTEVLKFVVLCARFEKHLIRPRSGHKGGGCAACCAFAL